ncbi:MAG TPA: Zn-dependent hydrolase [Aliidongia sp.]|nr:Zn-dependent hydrolase [Aliidongia sp.]
MTNLKIDSERLWGTLMETAEIGGTAKGGICRLSLTDLDRQVRQWFVARCEAAGCTITIDRMGNIFARRPGRDNSLKPIAFGSHLDTQPTGGKFDGVLGVLAGLELLRTLDDAGYETQAPIELINWTNEEGARFAPAVMGSGVFAGKLPLDQVLARQDKDGLTVGAELDRIGFTGPEPCGGRELGAFIELHIEQGPILEAEEKEVGIVTGVQGIRWYELTVTGRDAHAGTTPMNHRHDAFQGSARLAVALDDLARAHGPTAVVTIGIVQVEPGSTNVVPGSVKFTVDLRDPRIETLDAVEAGMRARIETIERDLGLEIEVSTIWAQAPIHFDARCIGAVRQAADAAGFSHREIVSGAGHDAAHISSVAPAAMIFVPCLDGISHNEAESITEAQAAAGAEMLLRTVLALAG